MARKPIEPETEPEERLDRTEHRQAMADLKALANRLAKLPQKVRRTLPMDEELQVELENLATSELKPNRRRTVMRVQLLLGATDLTKLEAALAGDTADAARDRECVRWRTRIIAGGDADLQAYIEEHPAADRQALRTAARDARGTGPAAQRAQTRLLQLLRAGYVTDDDT